MQDPRDMVEIFTGRMGYLFGAMLGDPALVQLMTQLLLQASVSRHVAPILLQYLVEHRLTDLQQPASKVAAASWQCSVVPHILVLLLADSCHAVAGRVSGAEMLPAAG